MGRSVLIFIQTTNQCTKNISVRNSNNWLAVLNIMSKEPDLVAKTSVLLDIKPRDDETNMTEILKAAKTIKREGLVWGESKVLPIAFGVNKLQLKCEVEDGKVSIDELREQIAEFEDVVQSVDVVAMP